MLTTLNKWGNSQGIRISKDILQMLDIQENEILNLEVKNESIIITKANQRKTISELFQNYTGEYMSDEIDFGEQAGREVW